MLALNMHLIENIHSTYQPRILFLKNMMEDLKISSNKFILKNMLENSKKMD